MTAAKILPSYGLQKEAVTVEKYGTGLINSTWKVSWRDEDFILQRVNNAVFEDPESIAHNTKLIADYLKENCPGYRFIAPITASDGADMIYLKEDGFFRLFPFVKGSHSIDVVETPEQAFEAATQFGRFTKLLSGFNVQGLKTTIPSFHDLSLRYDQFLTALENGNSERKHEAAHLITTLLLQASIVNDYKLLKKDPQFKIRVTHHDTKISNVLFDGAGKGLCVIDLDTVMPGYFISDVGDMMRTYLSPVSEEEQDFDKIEVRDDFYKAIVQGYYGEMKEELTEQEKGSFFYAGTFMIYMQALRFLTDHLNNDIYYGAKYPGHNLVRAQNQTILLQRLMEKEGALATYCSF